MLYTTTRNKNDVETAYKAIHLDCNADGGLFVPLRFPRYSPAQIAAMADRTFGQNVAEILNAFFSCNLTGWDVEFAVGRVPVKINTISHRILIAECWHNSLWRFDRIVQTLSDRLRTENEGAAPGNWVNVAVRIAALFGVYGILLASQQTDGQTPLDVAVTTGDFASPMAAWYAREMGLPIGNIVCGCNANGAVWDLLHRGEMSTGSVAVKTCTKDVDIAVPRNLERLISAVLGPDEANKYVDCCLNGAMYTLEAEDFELLRRGVFAAVISDARVENSIYSVSRTSGYVFGPYSALAYGSLLDYRAKTGESRPALLFTERSPVCDVEQVAAFMRVDVPMVFRRMGSK